MRQNTSVPSGKVPAPVEYAVTPDRARGGGGPRLALWPAPIATRPHLLQAVRAHHDPSMQSRVQSSPINHPSAPISIPFAPSRDPSVPSHLPSARIGTSSRPFAFRPLVHEEVCARRMRSTPTWVQYKRRGTTAREATISLCFTAWNSALSSLRETTCVDMALVGCWGDVKAFYSG
jgi:hypothetical protein